MVTVPYHSKEEMLNNLTLRGCLMARDNGASGTTKDKADTAIPTPDGIAPDWRARIALAKKIKQDAKEARKGKPMSFRTHLIGPR